MVACCRVVLFLFEKASRNVPKPWEILPEVWRDMTGFEWTMNKTGDYYETSVPGRKADAYMIEVADIAQGFPGYVTSLPVKLNDEPVQDRLASEAGWMGPPEKQD